MRIRPFGWPAAILLGLLLAACTSPDTGPSKSANADLSDLTASLGSLSPAFSAGTTSYTLCVPADTAGITVTGTTADSNASLGANNGEAQALSLGANPIAITVTAEDGATAKTYLVTVHRARYTSTNIGNLMYVPAGTFQRDATAGNDSVVSAFSISQFEITRAQFLAIMGNDPSGASYSSGPNDPVQNVSWYQAIAFCNKLSLAEGLTPVYGVTRHNGTQVNWATLAWYIIPDSENAANDQDWDAATVDWDATGYRLPTEMEYKWSAMGAPADGRDGGITTTGIAKAFAGSDGGNRVDDYAWYEVNSNTSSHPVGTKLANELGIFDMSGNVLEWIWDWYGSSIPTGQLIDYRGADSGSFRLLQSGSWYHNEGGCVISIRHNLYPWHQYEYIGFRVARP